MRNTKAANYWCVDKRLHSRLFEDTDDRRSQSYVVWFVPKYGVGRNNERSWEWWWYLCRLALMKCTSSVNRASSWIPNSVASKHRPRFERVSFSSTSQWISLYIVSLVLLAATFRWFFSHARVGLSATVCELWSRLAWTWMWFEQWNSHHSWTPLCGTYFS